MPRDFAQKPKTANRREPSRLPQWVWWVALSCAGLFLLALVALSRLPDDLESVSLSTPSLPVISSPSPEPEVPSAAEPTTPTRSPMEFYTLLRDTGVMVTDELLTLRQRDIAEVEAQAPAHEPVPNYIIQVASFAREGDAETLRVQLILEGLSSAHLVLADLGEQGQFYRVMVGPVQGLANAQAVAASLEQLGLQGMLRQQPSNP